jgi:hypothetical protein
MSAFYLTKAPDAGLGACFGSPPEASLLGRLEASTCDVCFDCLRDFLANILKVCHKLELN